MRSFANLFLLLFLADGSLSLLDELASILFPVVPLSEFRNLVANAVILLAIPLYLSLGIDQRLPKRLLLPLILFVIGSPLSTWIFPSLTRFGGFGLLMAAAQIALGTFLLHRLNKKGETPLTLPREMFDAPYFSLKNTLTFAGVNLFALPVFLVTLALFLANSYVTAYTSGFMRVEPGGLYMVERSYKRDDRTIRLAGMIHIGEKNYYEDVARMAVSGRTLVLAEGVTDEKELLRNKLDYGKVASLLGLTSQERMLFAGRVIDPKELDAPRDKEERGKAGAPDIMRADVDLSTFRPETMLLLDAMGKHLRGDDSVLEGVLELNEWAEKTVTPEMYEVIMDDILHRRNKVLLGYMDKALKRYDTVVIPWGALHMKEIEAEVLNRGFVLQEERKRMSVDFKRMLAGRM